MTSSYVELVRSRTICKIMNTMFGNITAHRAASVRYRTLLPLMCGKRSAFQWIDAQPALGSRFITR
jgi:hypothetical protein